MIKILLGIGSGFSIQHLTKKGEWISEDEQKRVKMLKMGIPIDLRLGFLYPDYSIRLIDLNIFGNYNSELSHYG